VRCDAARDYLAGLPQRFEGEAQTLARLTRWPIEQIRAKMERGGQSFTPVDVTPDTREWWQKLWPD
jgi:hypothetical protein